MKTLMKKLLSRCLGKGDENILGLFRIKENGSQMLGGKEAATHYKQINNPLVMATAV